MEACERKEMSKPDEKAVKACDGSMLAAEDGVCCLCGAAPKAEAKMLRRNVGASRMGICTEEEESKKVF